MRLCERKVQQQAQTLDEVEAKRTGSAHNWPAGDFLVFDYLNKTHLICALK